MVFARLGTELKDIPHRVSEKGYKCSVINMRVNGAAVARAVCVYSLRYLRSCVRLFVSPQLWRLCSVCVGRLASSWPRRHAACNAPEIGLRVSHSPDVSAMGACASAARRTTGRPHAPTRRLASLERRRLARACPGIVTRGCPPPLRLGSATRDLKSSTVPILRLVPRAPGNRRVQNHVLSALCRG